MRTAIIGIGSPFSQDRLGWRVVDCLRKKTTLGSNIKLFSCDRPGTLLLDYFKEVDCAVLIDAVEGGVCGNMVCIDKSQLLQKEVIYSSHQFGVAEALALGDALKVLPSQLVLYGVMLGDGPASCCIAENIVARLADIIIENFSIRRKRNKVLPG